MSDKAKVKCAGCDARRENIKETSIRIWRKAKAVSTWKRK